MDGNTGPIRRRPKLLFHPKFVQRPLTLEVTDERYHPRLLILKSSTVISTDVVSHSCHENIIETLSAVDIFDGFYRFSFTASLYQPLDYIVFYTVLSHQDNIIR
jgi:hypothetical protein